MKMIPSQINEVVFPPVCNCVSSLLRNSIIAPARGDLHLDVKNYTLSGRVEVVYRS